MTTMKLQRTRKLHGEGKGWVLCGSVDAATRRVMLLDRDWFERWFSTREAAESYAANRGWVVVRIGGRQRLAL